MHCRQLGGDEALSSGRKPYCRARNRHRGGPASTSHAVYICRCRPGAIESQTANLDDAHQLRLSATPRPRRQTRVGVPTTSISAGVAPAIECRGPVPIDDDSPAPPLRASPSAAPDPRQPRPPGQTAPTSPCRQSRPLWPPAPSNLADRHPSTTSPPHNSSSTAGCGRYPFRRLQEPDPNIPPPAVESSQSLSSPILVVPRRSRSSGVAPRENSRVSAGLPLTRSLLQGSAHGRRGAQLRSARRGRLAKERGPGLEIGLWRFWCRRARCPQQMLW